eukprot:UN01682
MRTDSFTISGGLIGSDGEVENGLYNSGSGYVAYWKQVCEKSSPAVVHLWVTNTRTAMHSYSMDSDKRRRHAKWSERFLGCVHFICGAR